MNIDDDYLGLPEGFRAIDPSTLQDPTRSTEIRGDSRLHHLLIAKISRKKEFRPSVRLWKSSVYDRISIAQSTPVDRDREDALAACKKRFKSMGFKVVSIIPIDRGVSGYDNRVGTYLDFGFSIVVK